SNGIIDQGQLKNLRYTLDDVAEAMREQGIFDLSQVQYAIVETNGKINFLQKDDTAKNPPEMIIKDGEIIKEDLAVTGLGEGWVRKILEENDQKESDVFVMSADSEGNPVIVPKNKGDLGKKEGAK
ncbi:MAG: DUF421 domain-containing protein, partial [Ruminiclostridium sp.]|nr:DUF421 domain-containing protein [Ruminiclostridium sp.]